MGGKSLQKHQGTILGAFVRISTGEWRGLLLAGGRKKPAKTSGYYIRGVCTY